MNSPQFSFNSANFQHTLKVFGWSIASAVVALIVANLANAQVPAQYVFLVPLANSALVAIQQFIAEQKNQ